MRPTFSKVDLNTTVCAIATPPGRGGLGIVRLSGPDALKIADAIFRGRQPLAGQRGYSIHLGFVQDPESKEEIDEVLASIFLAPKSFTGEDLVEFSAHGGQFILECILTALTASGAKLALPGEFSLRAFLNGRIDLTEAEAIADLIAAKTEQSATAALRQLKGELHREVGDLRQATLAALARLEIGVDFTEEDIDADDRAQVAQRFDELTARLERLLGGYQRGHILRDGFTVVLAGPPNVGKSTLFNYLARDERAIVTELPGTTRDVLREYINLAGWPVCLVDTAGMRDSTDQIERIGIGRAEAALGKADAIIWMLDAQTDLRSQLPNERTTRNDTPYLLCINKIDTIERPESMPEELSCLTSSAKQLRREPQAIIGISAKNGTGIEELLHQIEQWVGRYGLEARESELAINERHRTCLTAALRSIRSAVGTLEANGQIELVAFDTRAAAESLGEIIGETTTDDVLGEIFVNFCIGK